MNQILFILFVTCYAFHLFLSLINCSDYFMKKPILEGNLFLQKNHFQRNWLLIRFELTFLYLDKHPEQKALARSSLLGSDVLDYRQGWATKITTKRPIRTATTTRTATSTAQIYWQFNPETHHERDNYSTKIPDATSESVDMNQFKIEQK